MLRGFKKVTAETRIIYDRYMEKMPGTLHSDMYFPEMYAYDEMFTTYYCEMCGYLVIYVHDEVFKEKYCFMPLGQYEEQSFKELITELEVLFKEQELRFMFSDIPEWALVYFDRLKEYNLNIWYQNARSDYIYKMEDFRNKVESSPNRYKYRRFIRNNQPRYEIIQTENKQQCVEVNQNYWCELHDCSYCADGCEKAALERLIDMYEDMQTEGILVYDGTGKAIAFSIIGRINHQLLMIISKKKKLFGIAEYIHHVLLELYGEGVETVNNGIDLGLEGQRTFKSRCADRYSLFHNYNIILEKRR